MTVEPFVALTDKAWFDFLAKQAVDGVVDEVNFWSPRATRRNSSGTWGPTPSMRCTCAMRDAGTATRPE